MGDSNRSKETFENDEFKDGFSTELKYIIGITLLLQVIITFVGNALTIVSFLRDKQLRTVQNIYIFNLSLVDFAVGVVSVPYYIFYTINNYTWTFGRTWCKIWLVIDFLVCAESSLTIILISFDRFKLVSQGGSYASKQTVKKAVVYIICSWIVSVFLYGPAIIFWEYWIGARTTGDEDCNVEFFNNMEYTLITAVLEFLVPLVLTAYFNLRVYLNIRDRSRKISPLGESSINAQNMDQIMKVPRGQKSLDQRTGQIGQGQLGDQHDQGIAQGAQCQTEDQNGKRSGQRLEGQLEQNQGQRDKLQGHQEENHDQHEVHVHTESEDQDQIEHLCAPVRGQCNLAEGQMKSQHDKNGDERKEQSISQREGQNNPDHITVCPQSKRGRDGNKEASKLYQNASTSGDDRMENNSMAGRRYKTIQNTVSRQQNNARQILLQRDRKAARCLSILVIVYFVCWAPYTVTTFIQSIKPGTVNEDFYEATNFILWLNSALNPFLYALMSARFRKNFEQLLCPCVVRNRGLDST